MLDFFTTSMNDDNFKPVYKKKKVHSGFKSENMNVIEPICLPARPSCLKYVKLMFGK